MADRKPRILLVDDEPGIIKIVGKRLEVAGFEVLVAMNGLDAITKARVEHPDLIVLDLMLPDVDGFDICGHLKKDRTCQEIPIVVMFSGKGQEAEDIPRCRELGAAAYVTKTQGTAALIERINALLGRASGE